MTQTNKIALVTGGSRGLGKDMALNLAQKGNHVIITYNSQQGAAQEVVKAIEQLGVKAAALQLNTADVKSFDQFLNDLKGILKSTFNADRFHYLVNNAGTGIHQSFAETTEAQFDELLNIHFKGVFFLTQKALPIIADGGAIVNVSSGLARFSTPGYSAYAAMKGGIEVLTRYMAKELGARGIRANIIAPGAIETDFSGGAVRDNAQLNAAIASQTALGRVGLPEDIGSVVAFLCSDDAHWVTAQRLEASGGMFL
ncbi:NAD(P)-dependent dehydrogenase, short-chain alcohol dehydrogenase family [Chitinophaga rupis]|uniref:NAD(P)-dependent dehydrogenase, short-chain alcohol dehydrogenase family n=1 Tax=Chitinophaga rupis TaxID=573321 RepID=A0A1H7GZS6_9BACT|nr:SDR family oxidoreductase [Chitinophaga rupis]SEK42542.1 NAD(P)-dependent dehydrogenase, short-chain alcohol dehydrogenase family [Chitinophaga rupis]